MPTVQHISGELPPVADQWGTPVSKMPDCPNCREDELGMVGPDQAVCNLCGCIVTRAVPGTHIMDIPAVCKECPWKGTVAGCEPNDNGDLACPECGEEIVIRLAKETELEMFPEPEQLGPPDEPDPPKGK